MTRPDSEVAIQVVAALSDNALRTALRSGHRPSKQVTFWLDPNSAEWDRAVDLLPQVADDVDQLLIVNPKITREIINVDPLDKHVPEDSTTHVPYWPHPRLTITRSATPLPLRTWPGSIAGFLTAAEKAESEWTLDAELYLEELNELTQEWADSLGSRLGAWNQLTDVWTRDDDIYDPILGTGAAYHEVRALEKAIKRLSDLVAARPWKPYKTLEIATGASEVAVVSKALAWADSAVHSAIDAALPKIAHGRKLGIDRRLRAKELAAAETWVSERGSRRLRLAADAGLLAQSLGVYRDERLGEEWPGWMWVAKSDSEAARQTALNPTEEALTLLLKTRQDDPRAYLAYDARSRQQVLIAHFMGRLIWRPLDPEWPDNASDERDTLVVSMSHVLGSQWSPDEEPF